MSNRITPQPLPTRNDHPSIQSLVRGELALRIEDEVAAALVDIDLGKREAHGIEVYGTPLQPFNGRDVLRDAYEEALDLACYLKQAVCEGHVPLADMFEQTLAVACRLRRLMAVRDGEVA
jgi:hypothetical protein